MKPIIEIRELSKLYHLGARQAEYETLRESLVRAVQAPLKRLSQKAAQSKTLWALKDVSFEVQPGEVVGVIGSNGAGKSTLLKVLSQITEPTSGEVDLYGRVASLLEVGTGFHPELTGRENIYLNGAILGMRRVEIDQKFDDIVAFSEVEEFLDTPVKRYSSGMYVRLAFAVAAHLEPEILVVDEVLAVGDASFQKKCLGKMSDVARQGRTVLFVSHNMPAVKSLCSRAILLRSGRLVKDGPVDEVVNSYLTGDDDEMARTGIIPDDAPRLYGTDEAKLRSVSLTDSNGASVNQIYLGQPLRLSMSFEVFKPISEAVIEVGIIATDGTHVTNSSNIDAGGSPLNLSIGHHTVTLELQTVLLPRQYSFLIGLHHSDGLTIEWIERVLNFTVLRVAETGGDSYRWPSVRGYVRPIASWAVVPSKSSKLADGGRDVEDLVVGGYK
ncbi:MAG TPA: ABC transporter ATP-binding protein [Pyrinomonadaceae bacterium]|nr:ABC transporter ATP-binding protein [Pyrinomonadaceae bacterium]